MLAKTIVQAITEVLQREKKPLSVKDITERIVKNGLYTFKASYPDHVVGTQLRRHSDNISLKTGSKDKYFTLHAEGTYELKK